MSPPNWSSHGGPRSSWSTMTASPWAGSCPTTSSTHSCPATGGCTSRGSCNEHPGGGRAYRPRAAAAQGQGRPGLADPGPGRRSAAHQVTPGPDLAHPGHRGPRRGRCERRQRRGRDRDVRVGWLAVRLPDPVLHGAGHLRAGAGAGDGGAAGHPHWQGARRADQGAVQPAADRGGALFRAAGQYGTGGLGVRRNRRRLPAAWGGAIWALVLFGSYRYAERIFLLLSLAFLAYPVAAVLGHPDWASVGSNLVIPHFLYTKSSLLLGVALIGTTVSPYMQLYAAAGVVDKGADRADYPRARIDAISGALFACVISITIIIATAAAIGGHGALTSAKEGAQALRPAAGPGGEVLCALGLIGAWALAGAVVPLSSAYAISEAVGVERSVSRRFTEARLFLGLFTVQVIVGAALALTPINLITLLIGTQVLQGIVTPVILAYILILTNRRSVLGTAANGPVFRVAATLCVVAISAMSVLLLGFTVLGFFGIG